MPLPFAISVPHAGLLVPEQLQAKCRLTLAEIVQDGDEQAAEIYALRDEVAHFITTEVARAVVDLNRAPDDRQPDGVIKTHTCYDIPVWHEPLSPAEEQWLMNEHYYPYHDHLSQFAQRSDLLLAIDCHTMAAVAPPIAPDEDCERPWVCLGDVDGQTLPAGWMNRLVAAFGAAFGEANVTVNDPFDGGHITQTHGEEMPWLQLEISRAPFLPPAEKRRRVLAALNEFAQSRHS